MMAYTKVYKAISNGVRQVSSVNAVIEGYEQQIQQLNEMKHRMILNVVTGKIVVRGIEIPEYEYTEENAAADGDLESDESYEEVDNDGG